MSAIRVSLPLALVLLSIGCSKEPVSSPTASTENPAGQEKTAPKAVTADGVLEAMTQAYRETPSYADAGRVEVHAKIEGEPRKETHPFSVTFQRPNKLRMHVYQGNLIIDGQELRGWVDAQPGEMIYGQVLATEAPQSLTLENAYSDPVLGRVLTEGIAGSSLQLLLLLDSDPLVEIQEKGERPVLLEPESIEDRKCHRVLMARDDGKLILWVDQQDFTLRRVEVPIEGLKKHLADQGAKVDDVSVRMELIGATLGVKPDAAAFQFTTPGGAKLVKQFELLPPPPPQLGKTAPPFAMTMLDGKPLDKDGLMGRIAVIDFWFTTCPPCRLSLPNLEQVYQKYKDNDLVRFIAVSVDEADVKNEALTSLFGELKVNVPIARDSDGKLAQALGVSAFPTLIVLGPDGVVENFEMGYNPQLATTLPAKLDKLLAGESIYREVLKTEYRDAPPQAATPSPAETAAAPAKAEIAAKSEPKKLKLTKLWSYEELQQPGNLLIITEGKSPQIFVNDGWKQVVQLDAAGQSVAQHKLDVPAQDVVAALRTTVDKEGRRLFLGLANNMKQVHLFDDKWQKLLSYPPDRDHAGIADAQFIDLGGDGQSELIVSYWDVVGVQGVTLAGERLWANRSLEHVFRMAATGPNATGQRRVLCAHSRGTLTPINHEGVAEAPIAIGSNFARSIYSAQLDPDGPLSYLAIAANAEGRDTAIGINLAGEEQWRHPLPGGLQRHPVEFVTSGDVLGSGKQQWLLAGPDGSLHILSAAGEVIEQFNYGAALAGLAVTQINDKPALLISTAKGVEAWSVE